jgi:uncharacterized cupredoxin-like copper-binding protein
MRRSRFLVLLAALAVLGAGAACGGGDGGGGNAADKSASETRQAGSAAESSAAAVEVTAKEYAFEPKELKLVAGRATTIVLRNGGVIEHDITLDDAGFKLAVKPTKSDEAKLTIPSAGSYTFYCSVPGHRQLGMEGTVTVS